MKTVTLPAGEKVAALGQGTWNMGDSPATRADEIAALRRGIEWGLLPWLHARGVPVMAYSPLEQARLLKNAKFAALAKASGIAPAQLALAWLLARDEMIVIPKASTTARVEENAAARDITLSAAQIAELNKIFPPPKGARPLEML